MMTRVKQRFGANVAIYHSNLNAQEKYEQYKDVMLTYNSNFSMGDIIIADLDKDGKITEADKKIIGNQIPRYTFSLNLGFNYKALDFSAMFQGVGKVDGFLGRDILKRLWKNIIMILSTRRTRLPVNIIRV